MLFARLRTDDRAFWLLGPATYAQHESELPVAITWRLDHALPGDLFASSRPRSLEVPRSLSGAVDAGHYRTLGSRPSP